ncbi:MAG TPA: tRNA (adenosine(37)-N6)-threonylcarbamoyltransferase complex dimerization subunit type 1 TsaB [Gemmatimonadaceae bacterium]|nr:tRNA (adenosine(37)-N6)-threonylcarbamoyltransferase complex dimerization subunit type 1 TsaB [Gemmatimonadaceae bacterium]
MSASLMLALDASTYTGTVALIEGQRLLSECEVAMRGEKEERLMPAVVQLLSDAGARVDDLACVACGGGPGSFTSLRIAASIGKGIAAGRAIPLYSASSLLLMVAGSPAGCTPGRYLAVLDALRGDAYAAGYEVRESPDGEADHHDVIELAPLTLVSHDHTGELARSIGARCIGPREEQAAIPRASGFARIASVVERAGPVDLALWEPDYGRLAEAQVRWEREHGRPLQS